MKISPLKIIICFLTIIVISCKNTKEEEKESIPNNNIKFVLSDTGQDKFYDDLGNTIDKPNKDSEYFGQDAQYSGIAPSFKDNKDGTITDLNTGLIWQKTPDNKRYNFYDAFYLC